MAATHTFAAEHTASAPPVPMLIGGQWRVPDATQFSPVHNPSEGTVIARVPMGGPAEVDAAVTAAAKVFAHWSVTPAPRRAACLFHYYALLEKHVDELARLITREHGKTIEESRGDVRRGIEVVQSACGIAELAKGDSVPRVAEHIDAVTMREPIGVCAGITPFNFPAMAPMWMYPLAIACGNCFILKPSEKTPLTANRLAELFLEAGLPEGVLNVVHGGREVVDALCMHPGVASISFVGSSKVAEHVYTLGCRHGKRVQAAGGAKNVMVVMPDADPDSTVRAIMGAAFGCSGQRCMANPLMMGVGEAADALRQRVGAAIDQLKVGNTSADESVHMGPVIDPAAVQRITGCIAAGQDEGAELVRDGRSHPAVGSGGFFVGPTLFDHAQRSMRIAQDEIFGPVLTMLRPQDLDQAIAWANASPYGNGAVIFTSSGRHARQFAQRIHCGMVGVNVGVPAAMALFAFSGWNRSFFGDLHMQAAEGVMFFTRQKLVLSRWDGEYRRVQGW
jgi:malonate-semialdehyde dehydrogenase (acetylating) / methylmalonate-semialdehyde dehydrogenase